LYQQIKRKLLMNCNKTDYEVGNWNKAQPLLFWRFDSFCYNLVILGLLLID